MIFYSEEKGHHSHMVRIVLAEKDIACEIKEFNPEGKLPEELPTINPYNKLPVLVDREVTIYEPRVILEYLDERFPHPPLLPIYPNDKAECRLLIHRIEKDWLPVVDKMMSPKISQKEFDSLKKELVGLVSGIVLVLKEKPYFMSDEFSLVDCCIAPILWRLPLIGIELQKDSKTKPIYEYMQRVFTKPCFINSLSELEREIRST